MYRHLREWSDADPRGQVAADCGRRMLLLFAELSANTEEVRRGMQLFYWRPIPKCHLLLHVLEEFTRNGNARDNWCYGDESFIGEICDTAEACHFSHVQTSCLLKLRIPC